MGRVASGRRSAGLKYAELQMGPASGTLRPQQAGLGDGIGTLASNRPDKRWVRALEARPMQEAFRPGESGRRCGNLWERAT